MKLIHQLQIDGHELASRTSAGRHCISNPGHRLQDIPRLEMPLHTLIELVPKPDGKMAETRLKVCKSANRINPGLAGMHHRQACITGQQDCSLHAHMA